MYRIKRKKIVDLIHHEFKQCFVYQAKILTRRLYGMLAKIIIFIAKFM